MALARVGDAKHDGEFTQDIEINDLRNRYMLTKGSTQQQVSSELLRSEMIAEYYTDCSRDRMLDRNKGYLGA